MDTKPGAKVKSGGRSFQNLSNVLSVLDEVNYKLTQQSEVDCQILCLKMLSKILNYRSDALECYYHYLK
jgi:hypothetical protein